MRKFLVRVWIPSKTAMYVVKAETNLDASEKALQWFKKYKVQDPTPGEPIAEVVPEIE